MRLCVCRGRDSRFQDLDRRSRFWVLGPRQTVPIMGFRTSTDRRIDGQDLSVYFKWRCPGLIPGSFFFLFFSRPFLTGCPGLIPGFFYFFFLLPFLAGCLGLILGSFCFFFVFRPFPAGSLCMAELASVYFKWHCPGLIPGSFFFLFFPALFWWAAQG